ALPYPFQASRDGIASAPAISGVAVRREEQGEMVMPLALRHFDLDRDLGINRCPPRTAEPGSGLEDQPVSATRNSVRQPVEHSAVAVRGGDGDRPGPGRPVQPLQAHYYSGRGTAELGIEDVGGDPDHAGSWMSFCRRRAVIFSCSAAATVRSRSGWLASRARRSASRSAALFPVAQTM